MYKISHNTLWLNNSFAPLCVGALLLGPSPSSLFVFTQFFIKHRMASLSIALYDTRVSIALNKKETYAVNPLLNCLDHIKTDGLTFKNSIKDRRDGFGSSTVTMWMFPGLSTLTQ